MIKECFNEGKGWCSHGLWGSEARYTWTDTGMVHRERITRALSPAVSPAVSLGQGRTDGQTIFAWYTLTVVIPPPPSPSTEAAVGAEAAAEAAGASDGAAQPRGPAQALQASAQ